MKSSKFLSNANVYLMILFFGKAMPAGPHQANRDYIRDDRIQNVQDSRVPGCLFISFPFAMVFQELWASGKTVSAQS